MLILLILDSDEQQDMFLLSPVNQLLETDTDIYTFKSPVGIWSVEKNLNISPSKVNQNDRVKRQLFHEANNSQQPGNILVLLSLPNEY